MNTYKTHEVARMMGVHVNTVRLYETCRLIPKPERGSNGYRIFTDLHVEQFRLARAALQVEVLQNGLRKQAVEIIKICALGEFDKARHSANQYLRQVEAEICNANEAISIARQLMICKDETAPSEHVCFTRKQAAEYLQITTDTLRNWELNGLITVERKKNRYRIYGDEDIKRLKMIRSLRCANYSLAAILRMLLALSGNPSADMGEVLNTPKEDEDVITACDKLLTSLEQAKINMRFVLAQIDKMEQLKK